MRRGAIILCGGRSSRMGRDKALLRFGDEPMLRRVVRLVSEVVEPDRIVCAAAANQTLPPLPKAVEVVRDRVADRGPLEGLAVGLDLLADRADAAFVTSCDVPLLQPALVGRLFELLGDDEIAVPCDQEFIHTLAAVYRVSVLSHADRLLAVGSARMQDLVAACRARQVPVDELREVDATLDSLANCNEQADYERALAKAGY